MTGNNDGQDPAAKSRYLIASSCVTSSRFTPRAGSVRLQGRRPKRPRFVEGYKKADKLGTGAFVGERWGRCGAHAISNVFNVPMQEDLVLCGAPQTLTASVSLSSKLQKVATCVPVVVVRTGIDALHGYGRDARCEGGCASRHE